MKLVRSLMKLKECFTTASVLTLPQGIEGFAIYTNISNQGNGAVLMKNDKVVNYTSRQLKVNEINTLLMT